MWKWDCQCNVCSVPQLSSLRLLTRSFPAIHPEAVHTGFWQHFCHISCSFPLSRSWHAQWVGCLNDIPCCLRAISSCRIAIVSLMTSCPVSSSPSLSPFFWLWFQVMSQPHCSGAGMDFLFLSHVLAWSCLISGFPKGGLWSSYTVSTVASSCRILTCSVTKCRMSIFLSKMF